VPVILHQASMDLGDVSVDQHRMVELLFAKSEKKNLISTLPILGNGIEKNQVFNFTNPNTVYYLFKFKF
jgi:hypothetical protein